MDKVALRRMKGQTGESDHFEATNLKLICGTEEAEGTGYEKGDWSEPQGCDGKEMICDLRTKIEGKQGGGDDTALNMVQILCCPEYSRLSNKRGV